MAACLITITGTSGKVLLKYEESSIAKEAILDIGSIYLDDATVTDVTYSTLFGDAIASSGCFTITSLPLGCYHFKWDYSDIENYNFEELEIDGIIYTLSSSPEYPDITMKNIGNAINTLDVSILKAVQGNIDEVARPNFTLVIKTLAVDPPRLKVNNSIDSASFYIEGNPGPCSTVGYFDFNTCQPIILP